MKLISIFLLVFLLANYSFSQEESKDIKDKYLQAETYMDDGNFTEALKIYEELIKIDPENANYNFKIGFCYLNTVLEKEKAIPYLKKASTNTSIDYDPISPKERKAPIDALYYLGKAFHVNEKFKEAIDVLNEFRAEILEGNPDLLENVDRTINYSMNGMELVKYPVNFTITNLGASINSEYTEHSPVFSADESVLIYTSKREGSTGDLKTDDGQYYEDIYISTKDGNEMWTAPKSIGTNINTEGHEATIGLSVDGQQLFIYKDDNGDGNIYSSFLNGDEWSVPEKLGENINSKSRETHASISADGNYLYFTSDRKGGYGGLDIYVSKKLPNGKWGSVQNLGPKINTKYNEEGPFIHPDGVTLFFSSEGHNSMGGYDIFYATVDNETRTCSDPTNIGYPINSTEDDVFYMPTPDGKRAYYASYKSEGLGNTDIYLITLADTKEKPLTVMTGVITLSNGEPPTDINITVTDLKKQEVVGIYTPNSKTGKYLFILTPGIYNILFESSSNDLYHSENITVEEGSSYKQINKPIELKPIVIGNTTEKYFAEFLKQESKIDDVVKEKLDLVANILNSSKHLIVDIETLSEFKKDKALAEKREKAVSDYLVSKGIDLYRIMSALPIAPDQDNVIQVSIGEREELIAANNTNNNNNSNNTNNNQQNNDPKNTAPTNPNDVTITNIFFDFDKDQTSEYYTNMDKLASYLVTNTEAKVEIHGYTDLQGDEEYNNQLSIRRAKFAKDYLVNKGCNKSNISIKGFGETNQISSDLNPDSRKYNRRVEFKVLKQGTYKLTVEPIKVPKAYQL